ncbi:12550_t:CDS:2 [Cetraspora pellucida]|uniref:12550_t:CDS:1 n=1 Tax=Cetraspora pellucida TaxID=1433469 RepID=A0A9N9AXZ6_9GLOM|nr:12550_t:CDS:2 [Cetraspora pellucida]
MLVILDIQEFEIPDFFRFARETSKAMGDRFEWFCVKLLRRYFERLGIRVIHTGGTDDKEKISDEAYISAEKSEHDIIVTTYRNMCQNIKNLIAGRLSRKLRDLEDRRRFLEDRCRFLEDRYASKRHRTLNGYVGGVYM